MVGGRVRINPYVVGIVKSAQNNGRSLIIILYLLENKRMPLFLKAGCHMRLFSNMRLFLNKPLPCYFKKTKGKATYAPIFDVRVLLAMSLFSSKYSMSCQVMIWLYPIQSGNPRYTVDHCSTTQFDVTGSMHFL